MVEFNPEVNNSSNVAPQKRLEPKLVDRVSHGNSIFMKEEVDTNGDGVYDAYVYTTTTNGVVQQRITDKNKDDIADIIENYDNGQVIRKEEYEYYEGGYAKYVSDGKGNISTMETYKTEIDPETGEETVSIVDVAYDSNGDGIPDYNRPPQMGI